MANDQSDSSAADVRRLISRAKTDRVLAKALVRAVLDFALRDDELRAIVGKSLRVERRGKPKGRAQRWDNDRYQMLLVHYFLLLSFRSNGPLPRNDILERLAGIEGFQAKKSVEKRISQALSLVPLESLLEDLPEAAHPMARKSYRARRS